VPRRWSPGPLSGSCRPVRTSRAVLRWVAGLTGSPGCLALSPVPKGPGPVSEHVINPPPSVGATALNIKFIVLFLHSKPNPLSPWGSAEGRIFTVPACLPARLPPLNPQSIYLWSLKRSEGQGLRRNGNLFWRTGGRGQRTCYPPPHTREQSTPSSPVSWGERTTSAPPAQLGLLLGGQRCREGAGAATEEKRSLQIHERKLFFGAKKERPRDTFLSPQVLKSSGQLLHTFCSGGHLVAGGTGLVEQVHRTLEASGGVVGCSHELIAGEAHLWGCQVGTELLWPQLDSIVVLIDCFRESLSLAIG